MFLASPIEPAAPVATANTFRPIVSGVERNVLPQAAPAAASSPDAGHGRFPQGDKSGQTQPAPLDPKPDASAMFAAAVISGSLSPRPQSVNEVYLRIGITPVPTELEPRLKDLTA